MSAANLNLCADFRREQQVDARSLLRVPRSTIRAPPSRRCGRNLWRLASAKIKTETISRRKVLLITGPELRAGFTDSLSGL
jgi:hypothetical protein